MTPKEKLAKIERPKPKHVYIRTEDAPVWEQAQREATKTKQPLSALIATALREHFGKRAA